ncbi:MAG: alanine--tRNA ligase [Gammaproteobacteria bacterium]|nr:alanine--tRNA ligase [Gammaproteobacteria bacterium]
MESSAEIRNAFLGYFRDKGHEIVPSSSLVPANDPTLLFTNAGMIQFKDVFLGLDERPYKRAASSQRCVRVGGKHNDLENVGYTARHHTFFEMLGNFSFGDYFKHEAIGYSWEFLTEVLGVSADRLWITVFENDDEAADIWLKEVGVDPAQFARCGAANNFWSMGDMGPCGPCTEIFYDHGEGIPGNPPSVSGHEGDRYVEIWNLVFTQYNRDANGKLDPIPHPSVDTGMGLERIAAVMQGVHSNYDIDIFRSLIHAISEIAGGGDLNKTSLQVIADHIRSCAFLVVDGVVPSNEGRGYVLRRIIRRAIRHGYKLGLAEPFLYKLVAPLDREMGTAYPELAKNAERVEHVLKQEEERFAETLDQGMKLLEEVISKLSDKVISGKEVFKLYDTYGFPVDLTADIARERGLTLEMEGFEAAMAEQRDRARAASKFEMDLSNVPETGLSTEFCGYETLEEAGKVLALYYDGEPVNELSTGQTGGVVLERTPFYAEAGGQVGDRGTLQGEEVLFEVSDTQKQGDAHVHIGVLARGTLRIGQKLTAKVDGRTRRNTVRNHTATHLVHAALRKVLGESVIQKGSLVAPDRLRFDFSHPEPVEPSELKAIERMVNSQILANSEVVTNVMPLDKALESGAMSLFGEKYADNVRVLSITDFSTELCGGTHVRRAGDIGFFKITSETGIAAGIRRIEAVTGEGALDWTEETDEQLANVQKLLRVDRDVVGDKITQLLERMKALEKEVERLKAKLASSAGSDLASQAVEIDGIKVLAATLEGAEPKTLRDTVDQLKNKLGTAALVLASVVDNKVSLVAGVTQDSTEKVKAGELVNFVARQVGGRGGGRADMAQAGGTRPEKLDAALERVPDWVRKQVRR